MAAFLADENFNHDILYGIWRDCPAADIRTVQDEGLRGRDDPTVLEHSAQHGLIVLTHDVKTMPRFAATRMASELTMPGLIVVPKDLAIGRAIEDLLIVVLCSKEGEFENQIVYLPI